MSTIDLFNQLFATPVWWSYLLRVVIFYLLAWMAHRLSNSRFGRMPSIFTTTRPSKDRHETTRRLISSFITVLAFVIATIFSLSLFVPADSLLWAFGLFTGGFGIALMPVLRDFFTGISFLFEDTFDVGEKVELLTAGSIEGVVEHVNLRTTSIRARSGELYTVPNGEIRVVRNFSRGHFSVADVVLAVDSDKLNEALDVLQQARDNALLQLPNLLEPWQVISESGEIGRNVQLRLVAKAKYGKAAEMRPRLLAFVHDCLTDAQIELVA